MSKHSTNALPFHYKLMIVSVDRGPREGPISLLETLQRAVQLHQRGELDQAGPLYEEILAAQPGHFEILHRLGILRYQQGRGPEALEHLNAALLANPGDVAAWSNAGLIRAAMGRHAEALTNYDKALALRPDYVEALVNRGVALRNLMRPQEALASFDQALAFRPAYPEALNNRGNALRDLERSEEALASYDAALALKTYYPEALNNRGNALKDLKRLDEALASFDAALGLRPAYAEAAYNKGTALLDLNRLEEALASCDIALALRPDYAEAHNNRGAALAELNRYEEALASCDRALALKPDYAEAWSNRGNALRDLDRLDDALASYDRAVQRKPDYAEAYANRGDILDQLKRFDEALLSYERAHQLKPDADFLAGKLLHTRMKVCDWRAYDEDVARLPEQISRLERIVHPFAMLALSGDPGLLRRSSEIWAKAKYGSGEPAPAIFASRSHAKIRIGYFSSDFHQHATALLMAGLFEAHDRARFDVTAFSFGLETGDRMRQRLKASFDRFIDVRASSDREIVALARELEIDIAVDLKGFTQDARSRLFAMRAAPVQVNYLGYPGTMGSDGIDYLIADAVVIPPEQRRHYSEKIVYLPDAYQPNDRKREISGGRLTRAEAGLPPQSFVFCCFNNNFKIVPAQFDGWMRILKAVDGAVLWLFEDNSRAASNLRSEARARGVDPDRIVFAPRAPAPEHLARHRLADLFLDTLPFNAHTTASDALWAGLPLLTQAGETFAGRVAASLLQAIGLPELIAPSPEAYEALAVELARSPAKLAAIRHKLERNRLATPLFDTARFTRHIEAAYAAMHQRCQAGLPPDHIRVQD